MKYLLKTIAFFGLLCYNGIDSVIAELYTANVVHKFINGVLLKWQLVTKSFGSY